MNFLKELKSRLSELFTPAGMLPLNAVEQAALARVDTEFLPKTFATEAELDDSPVFQRQRVLTDAGYIDLRTNDGRFAGPGVVVLLAGGPYHGRRAVVGLYAIEAWVAGDFYYRACRETGDRTPRTGDVWRWYYDSFG